MTMDAKTETALLASIDKWQENARAEAPDDAHLRQEDCPLCLVHHPDYSGQEGCKGCPVSERTGMAGCWDTPYFSAYNASFDWWFCDRNSVTEHKARFQTAAQAMANFLASLLPEGKQ